MTCKPQICWWCSARENLRIMCTKHYPDVEPAVMQAYRCRVKPLHWVLSSSGMKASNHRVFVHFPVQVASADQGDWIGMRLLATLHSAGRLFPSEEKHALVSSARICIFAPLLCIRQNSARRNTAIACDVQGILHRVVSPSENGSCSMEQRSLFISNYQISTFVQLPGSGLSNCSVFFTAERRIVCCDSCCHPLRVSRFSGAGGGMCQINIDAGLERWGILHHRCIAPLEGSRSSFWVGGGARLRQFGSWVFLRSPHTVGDKIQWYFQGTRANL